MNTWKRKWLPLKGNLVRGLKWTAALIAIGTLLGCGGSDSDRDWWRKQNETIRHQETSTESKADHIEFEDDETPVTPRHKRSE
jgi:hypothetical protein